MHLTVFTTKHRLVNGKLEAEVFTLESEDVAKEADITRLVYKDGKWVSELPDVVEVNKLVEHAPGGWSRHAGYEVRYRVSNGEDKETEQR